MSSAIYKMGVTPSNITVQALEPRPLNSNSRSSSSSSDSPGWQDGYPRRRAPRWSLRSWLKIAHPSDEPRPLASERLPRPAPSPIRSPSPSAALPLPGRSPTAPGVGALPLLVDAASPGSARALARFFFGVVESPARQVDPFVRFLHWQSSTLRRRWKAGGVDLPWLRKSEERSKDVVVAAAATVVERELARCGKEIPQAMRDCAERWSGREWISCVEAEAVWLLCLYLVLVEDTRGESIEDLESSMMSDETIGAGDPVELPRELPRRLLAAVVEERV
ncbi:hypothetical protein NpPPO83_00010594 [Neofusicoccum parvum]|uniref:Uncharacterized protein n=1 Tax=Neofusicoccum parvum TaxID=310453 RepID=A0ACB5SLK7_9PEZI|nr:hypothetical protein NpPPO83_00010594 [Neofusicoccum parvum]